MKSTILVNMILLMMIAVASSVQARTITISSNSLPDNRRVLRVVTAEALRRLGHELKLIEAPFARSLELANGGAVDGEGVRIAGLSSRFENLVRVPEPYVSISFSGFAVRDDIKLTGWASLKPYRLAFMNGWHVYETNTVGAASIVRVKEAGQMFRMLTLGRVDIALFRKQPGLALIERQNLTKVRVLEPPLRREELFLYLHKRHRDLAQALAEELRNMKASGDFQRLISKGG